MEITVQRLALAIPLALTAVIAGCGSSSSSTAVRGAQRVAAVSTSGGGLALSETEFKITPAAPSVAHTGTITITVRNTGAVTHALTMQTPAGPVSTSSIAPGKTATLKVNASKPGRYTFFCPIPGHEQAGMKGTLVVGSASANASGGGGAPYKTNGY
jgi:uncharacterized cupredoxin-like copper-binding protein